MSQKSLPSRLLNTTVSFYRESLLKTEIGDFDKMQESLVFSNVPATIQPKESELEYEIEGNSHYQTHVCYMNTTLNGTNVAITVNDIAKDDETGIKYRVISCHENIPSNVALTQSHHYKLLLEKMIPDDDAVLTAASVSSKVSVSEEGDPPMN